MANLPWILIGAGIVFVIVGCVLVVVAAQAGPLDKRHRSEPRRSHQEIRELLEDKGPPVPAHTVVLFVGLVCILVGIAWRSFKDGR